MEFPERRPNGITYHATQEDQRGSRRPSKQSDGEVPKLSLFEEEKEYVSEGTSEQQPSSQRTVDGDDELEGSFKTMERALGALTAKVQRDVREDLRLFLLEWAPQPDLMATATRRTDWTEVDGNISQNISDDDSDDDNNAHAWISRPLKSYLATEVHKAAEHHNSTPKNNSHRSSLLNDAVDPTTSLNLAVAVSNQASGSIVASQFLEGRQVSGQLNPRSKSVMSTRPEDKHHSGHLVPRLRSGRSVHTEHSSHLVPPGIPNHAEENTSDASNGDSHNGQRNSGFRNSGFVGENDPMFRDTLRTVAGSQGKGSMSFSTSRMNSDITLDPGSGVLSRCLYRTRHSAELLVQSEYFNIGIGLLIALNAIWIGIQTEYGIRAALQSRKEPVFLKIVSSFFCFFFLAELLLRITVYTKYFFVGDDWCWNLFDFTIVVMQCLEEVLGFLGEQATGWAYGSSWMRILRVLRLVRIMRLVRILRLLRELRTMLASIIYTFRSLVWTMVLLALVTFAGSVYVTQMVADHALAEPDDDNLKPGKTLHKLYSSLPRSFVTLYQCISGGIDWSDALNPLEQSVGVSMTFAFCCYIAFTTFSLLNIVTGIFVESALQNTKDEADLNMVNRLWEVFKIAELPDNGRIDFHEFERACDHEEMKAYFKSVDLDISEAKNLFRLLDVDDSGSIQSEDFVMGCLRLRGTAKAIDLATLMSETRRSNRKVQAKIVGMQHAILRLQACEKGGDAMGVRFSHQGGSIQPTFFKSIRAQPKTAKSLSVSATCIRKAAQLRTSVFGVEGDVCRPPAAKRRGSLATLASSTKEPTPPTHPEVPLPPETPPPAWPTAD